ncbi:hypothetical protein FEM48_Zijuj10G0126800 [Ziziphus jujuba var. spinosa]|uniref:Uncharacterized protein n=1 Tax=Ziziphus jujuba var. spinosa TaxID=714518 RepID=A0A978UNF9_ZIZJJ|nr:hypothetical protein FEM48_Zijuj10G0126800 [Ziziphus jujuba var. spinosa]
MSLIQSQDSQPSISSIIIIILILFFLGPLPHQAQARKPHVIHFRSQDLYPEGITWDPTAQRFIVGSFRDRTLLSVSNSGAVETLISDHSLPENVSFLGLAIDSVHNRLLAAVQAMEPLPHFHALAAYDLRSRRRVFLSPLPSNTDNNDGKRQIANDVTVDSEGNAYVTNSAGNFIWKVDDRGSASIFSKSAIYNSHPVDKDAPASFCGLNGIVYASEGYFLVVQTNTGKMYKVDAGHGTARQVVLREDLELADGIAMRKDGVVVVVSQHKAWLLKSEDNWGEAVVYDKIDLEQEGFPTSVVVGVEERIYVVYSYLLEVMRGNVGRDEFRIVEVRSEKESREEDHVWMFVLIGLGLACFLFWGFHMRRFANNSDKKAT